MSERRSSALFLAATAIAVLAGLYLALLYAPTERTMGDVQRIFYFHVSSAWSAFLAFTVTCFGSVMFLLRRDMRWDRLAGASSEIGVVFCTIVLITGSLWAHPVWGIWWTWDARLTLTLVLWLIFVSYLMLRGYIEHESKRAFLSAIFGIIGFLDVPLVYFSIRWWRTQHPQPVIAGGEESGLEPSMLFTLLFCVGAFTLLYAFMLRKKIALERARGEIEYLYKLTDQK